MASFEYLRQFGCPVKTGRRRVLGASHAAGFDAALASALPLPAQLASHLEQQASNGIGPSTGGLGTRQESSSSVDGLVPSSAVSA